MINTCRAYNIRVYVEITVNHMVGAGNDWYDNHTRFDCSHFGAKEGTAGSPFWGNGFIIEDNPYTNQRFQNEYPSVPFLPSYFHSISTINDWDDPIRLTNSYLVSLADIDTEKE